MSAMESVLKMLAGVNDIKAATTKLRGERVWGRNLIVKDGVSIWNHLHNEYPDVRHGHPIGTDIDLEEAVYWIDRIMTYIRFMAAKQRVLGR